MKNKNRRESANSNITNKNDNSLRVSQRDKIDTEFKIRPFPWTEKQQNFIDISLDNKTNIILCRACAGVGKTLLSLYCSLVLLSQKKIGEIFYFRVPLESCSYGLGYLTGDKDMKLDPHSSPLKEHLNELLEKPTINSLLKEERIKVDSIGFIKGRTFNNCAILADECEDMTKKDLALLLSRYGRHTKMFIIGDSNQANIKNSGFDDVFDAFNNERARNNGIFCLEFDKNDCKRSEITKFIIETFENLK